MENVEKLNSLLNRGVPGSQTAFEDDMIDKSARGDLWTDRELNGVRVALKRRGLISEKYQEYEERKESLIYLGPREYEKEIEKIVLKLGI